MASIASLHYSGAVNFKRKYPVEAFLQELVDRDFSENTIKNYKVDLELFKKWVFERGLVLVPPLVKGDTRASADHHVISQYFQKEGSNWSSATKARKVACFRSFYKWAYRWDLLTFNPMEKMGKIRLPKRRPQPIPADVMDKILGAIPAEKMRDRLILLLLQETGMRISEVLSIRVEQLDLQKRKDESMTVTGKGRKERTVFLFDAPKALKLLKTYLKKEGIWRGYIFPGNNGQHLHYTTFQRHWLGYLEKAGVDPKGRTLHKIRHSYATEKIEAGMDISDVGILLGHECEQTTRTYAAFTDRLIKSRLKAMAKRRTSN